MAALLVFEPGTSRVEVRELLEMLTAGKVVTPGGNTPTVDDEYFLSPDYAIQEYRDSLGGPTMYFP